MAGIGALFSKPKVPKPQRMPDPEDPNRMAAAIRKRIDQAGESGRASTIFSADGIGYKGGPGKDRGGTNQSLGGTR